MEPTEDSVLERLGALPRPWRLLIDGRSGAGKTSFAGRIAAGTGAQLIHLDDIYPGWSGLEAASRMVAEELLGPRHRWRRWDWQRAAPAEWHLVDPETDWIVEGCGALSGRSRQLADYAVWLSAADAVRKRRALGRDGAAFAAHWDMWAAQELAFIARERPMSIADAVVRT